MEEIQLENQEARQEPQILERNGQDIGIQRRTQQAVGQYMYTQISAKTSRPGVLIGRMKIIPPIVPGRCIAEKRDHLCQNNLTFRVIHLGAAGEDGDEQGKCQHQPKRVDLYEGTQKQEACIGSSSQRQTVHGSRRVNP